MSAPTRSREDAEALLRRYRGWLIALGQHVAAGLCRDGQTTTSRAVREAMDELGAFEGYAGTDAWLGVVFSAGPFEAVGTHTYGDAARNLHDGHVAHVWRLRPGGICPHPGVMPALPDVPTSSLQTPAAPLPPSTYRAPITPIKRAPR